MKRAGSGALNGDLRRPSGRPLESVPQRPSPLSPLPRLLLQQPLARLLLQLALARIPKLKEHLESRASFARASSPVGVTART